MHKTPSDDELKQFYCFEPNTDTVPNDPETSAFKKSARLHQSKWRDAQGFPPIDIVLKRTKNDIVKEYPKTMGTIYSKADAFSEKHPNFISKAVKNAVDERISNKQKYEMLDKERLFTNLLSSMPMCFNLFGEFQQDTALATLFVKSMWPEMGLKEVEEIVFEWSPGRSDPEYLGNRSAFDTSIHCSFGDNTRGVIGIETKYHEHCEYSKTLIKEDKRAKYESIHNKSGVFLPETLGLIKGSYLEQIWLDHLLALSMTLHQSGSWRTNKFVLVYPEKNISFSRAADIYAKLLKDSATFEACTIEQILDVGILPPQAGKIFRQRYLW